MGVMSVTVLLSIILTSCISPRIIEKPSNPVNFSQFETVSYTIHDNPSTQYGSNREFGESTIALLDAMLRIKLREMGYRVVDLPEFSEFSIELNIRAAKPGSAALRFLVGLGAGRAILLFDALFVDGGGDLIASFEGGRSHTGMEFGEGFAGEDQIQAIAVSKSVKQIQEFIANNGAFSASKNRRGKRRQR